MGYYHPCLGLISKNCLNLWEMYWIFCLTSYLSLISFKLNVNHVNFCSLQACHNFALFCCQMISKEICNTKHKSNIFMLHYKYLQLGIVKTQPDSAICDERNAVSLLCCGSTRKEAAKKTSSVVNSLSPL